MEIGEYAFDSKKKEECMCMCLCVGASKVYSMHNRNQLVKYYERGTVYEMLFLERMINQNYSIICTRNRIKIMGTQPHAHAANEKSTVLFRGPHNITPCVLYVSICMASAPKESANVS